MDRAGRRYLVVSLGICLVSMLLGPPMPEHLLLRHLRRIERRIETSPSPEAAVEAVTLYLEANRLAIERIQHQLHGYDPDRSLAAFRRLERRLEKVSATVLERPELARELGDSLLNFLP